MPAEILYRRRTADGRPVEVDADGLVWGASHTYTRHAGLPRQAAYEVAEAAGLFDAVEMPSLVAAAAELSRGGRRVGFWTLVRRAILLSHRAGTIPADMPPAMAWVTLAAPAQPGDEVLRSQGWIPAARPGRRVLMPVPRTERR